MTFSSVWDVPEAYRQSMPPTAKKTKGSRLNCDCNARWLRDWLIETELGDITCAFPSSLSGVSVAQLDVRHFVCGRLFNCLKLNKAVPLINGLNRVIDEINARVNERMQERQREGDREFCCTLQRPHQMEFLESTLSRVDF